MIIICAVSFCSMVCAWCTHTHPIYLTLFPQNKMKLNEEKKSGGKNLCQHIQKKRHRQAVKQAGWHARTHVFTEQFTLFGVSLKVYVSMHSNYGFMNGSTQSVYTVSCKHWIPIHRYKLHTLIKTEAKLILMNTQHTHAL